MIQSAINNCEPGTLIFIEDLYLVDPNVARVRKQLMRLADTGQLIRFSRGVYYKPIEDGTEFNVKKAISSYLDKKYLKDGDDICGYIIDTAKRIEISKNLKRPPENLNVIELASNKATMDYKEFRIGNVAIIVRRPRIPVNRENHKALAFLDLVKDIEVTPKVGDDFQMDRSLSGKKLLNYLTNNQIDIFKVLANIEKYPDKTIRNLWLLEVSREQLRDLAENK